MGRSNKINKVGEEGKEGGRRGGGNLLHGMSDCEGCINKVNTMVYLKWWGAYIGHLLFMFPSNQAGPHRLHGNTTALV